MNFIETAKRRYSVCSEFSLPDNLEPVNILAIGYSTQEAADPNRHATHRIAMTELVLYQ